jgi:hypothetical protein
MTRPLAIAALLAGSFLAAAPAAQADPIVPRMCHYWTDYPLCTPEVANPLDNVHIQIERRCFYWTDYPTCIPPR